MYLKFKLKKKKISEALKVGKYDKMTIKKKHQNDLSKEKKQPSKKTIKAILIITLSIIPGRLMTPPPNSCVFGPRTVSTGT